MTNLTDNMRTGKGIWFYLTIIVVVVCVIWWWCWFNPTTTILLVRHADKGSMIGGNPNVNLSSLGETRAAALINVANEAGVTAIYANEWCRTAQTADPIAVSIGLSIFVEQVSHPSAGLGGCSPAITASTSMLLADIDTPDELIDHILSAHQGGVVLIVAHSNTVPMMINKLGESAFTTVNIAESEYDRLFVATTRRYFSSPRLIKAQYGN